jgi:hypothetical protein
VSSSNLSSIAPVNLKQDRAHSVFNDTFDRIVDIGLVGMPSSTFNTMMRAMEGMSTISRLLVANECSKADLDQTHLKANVIGGLHDALRALSDFSIEAMEDVIIRHEAHHE